MALRYQTEYSLGRRGRICRTYSGIPALIAIGVDMVLGLAFGAIAFVIRLIRFLVVTAFRVAILPLKVARAVSDHFAARPAAKPTWATLDDL